VPYATSVLHGVVGLPHSINRKPPVRLNHCLHQDRLKRTPGEDAKALTERGSDHAQDLEAP
jgi:hypothetical protein